MATGKVHLVKQNVKALFRTSTAGYIILIKRHLLPLVRACLRNMMEALLGSRSR